MKRLLIDENLLSLKDTADYVFGRGTWAGVEISPSALERVEASRRRLIDVMESGRAIYGVTTGFGDSCHRRVGAAQSEALQRNLVAYLVCGTGSKIPRAAAKATLLARLKSLCRGYSGVTTELVDTMRVFLERDWVPVIPREGSLGASGDLIPLAYLARALQGEGTIDTPAGERPAAEVLREAGMAPYQLKVKEGLALVNGTSAMVGLAIVNLAAARFIADLAALATGWVCLALGGRPDAFGRLVNDFGKIHPGQSRVARCVRAVLEAEGYAPAPATTGMIQDRYSLRCTPQVLGPVVDTIAQVERWVELEINGTSDNPLVAPDGDFAMGGNFYGGYLGHGMDYLKICLGHVADLLDRQLAMVIDEKSSRGLPPNLANWPGLPEEERHLHHGLKGLHQAMSAITSEVMARTMPNGVFSRSAELHNQDKVSLGMSAAVACQEMTDTMFTLGALHLTCLAQALDLRDRKLTGSVSRKIFESVREHVPFVERDRPLDAGIRGVADSLKRMAWDQGGLFQDEET